MKKAQATLFIIIALIIIALGTGTFYVKQYLTKTEWEREKAKVAIVPPQAEKIKLFVEDCIQESVIKATEILGMQGGYIDLPKDIVPVSPANPFSNSLALFNEKGIRVIYWYYQKENLVEADQIPKLRDMEVEISNYIKENLKICLGNFEEFKKYKITQEAINNVEVEIRNRDILTTTSFPLHIELEDFKFDFEKFYVKVDSNLGRLYNLATEFISKENTEQFLEEKTLDMMILYDQIPFTGTTIRCGPEIWLKQDVENNFKKILETNIAAMRIKNTNYETENKYFELDITNDNYNDVYANLIYSSEWPLKLDIEPSEDGILKSDSLMKDIMSRMLCINVRHFIYDVKYPVLITLGDEDGYLFQVATQVIINNNQPRKDLLSINTIEPKSKIDYCNQLLYEQKIYTYSDKDELRPLDNVSISFKCTVNNCHIGFTNLDNEGKASLIKKFPPCGNGFLIGEKENYHKTKEIISTNEELLISLILEPYITKIVEAELIRGNNLPSGKPFANEKVIIELKNSEKEYSTTIVYPDNKNVKLITGDYQVKAYVTYDGRIIIPEKKIRKCVEVPKTGIFKIFGGGEECFDTTIEGSELDQVTVGGAEFEFSVSEEDLKYDYLKFYIPSGSVPTDYDEMNQIYDSIKNATKNPNFIYPRFLNE